MPPQKSVGRNRNRSQSQFPPYWDIVDGGAGLRLNFGRLPAPSLDYQADDAFVEDRDDELTLWFLQFAPSSSVAVSSLGVTASRNDLASLLAASAEIEARLHRLSASRSPRSEPDVSRLGPENIRKVPGSVFLVTTDEHRAMIDVFAVEVFTPARLDAAKTKAYAPHVHAAVRIFLAPTRLSALLASLHEVLA